MIGQTRIVQLPPEEQAKVLRHQKSIENLLASRQSLLERIAEDACRNEGFLIPSDRIKDIQVLPDGNLQIAY